jgi:hypothetical protein
MRTKKGEGDVEGREKKRGWGKGTEGTGRGKRERKRGDQKRREGGYIRQGIRGRAEAGRGDGNGDRKKNGREGEG